MTPQPSTAELLYACAVELGMRPSWLTPKGLFAVTIDGKERYINYARSPLNSHVSISLAKNKYLTRLILERQGFKNIPFLKTAALSEATAFLAEHKTIIAKPIDGSGSRDIHLITKDAQLETLQISKYILEQYVVGNEMRYLVLDHAVIGVHRSDYGVAISADRPLRRISYPRSTWDRAQCETAIAVAQALDLQFGAVDFLVDAQGKAHILEVNTSPGLKWFHTPSDGPPIDVARLLLDSYASPKTISTMQIA